MLLGASRLRSVFSASHRQRQGQGGLGQRGGKHGIFNVCLSWCLSTHLSGMSSGKLRLQLPLVVNVGLSLGLEQRQQVWRCGGWKRLLETPVLSTDSLPVPSETLPVFREEAYVCGEDGETEALGYPSCQNEAR